MELCLNTSTLADPGRPDALPLPEKIRLAAAAGFRHIEPWHSELTAWTDGGGTLAEIKAMVADAGLSVPSVISLMGWMDAEGPGEQAAMDEVARRLEQAAAIGAPRMVASPTIVVGDVGYDIDLDRAAARYRALLELGGQIGVWPMMEFLGFVRSVHLLEEAVAIAELADHPQATVVLDPFHLWRGGSGFGRIGSLRAEQVGICHFNDAPAANPPRGQQSDADRVYPGDGCLPLEHLLRTLATIGYDGPLSLELFNPGYWALDPAENLRRGLAATRSVMAAAGLA
jgi:sugar phosphate isomerase/epimerase